MKNPSLLLLLSPLLLLNSCALFPNDCAKLDSETLSYLPYSEEEMVQFKSNDESVSLQCKGVSAVESGKVPYDCPCQSRYRVDFQLDTLHIFLQTSFESNEVDNLKNALGSISSSDDDWWSLKFSSYSESYMLENIEFTDVVEFAAITEYPGQRNPNIRILISKYYGIISIIIGENEWLIENPQKKSIQLSEIDVKVHTC